MENQSFFKSPDESITPADVAAAIVAMDATIMHKCTKPVFRDLLTGLKILIKSMEQNDFESHSIILQWLKLFLRVENALDPNNGKLREQFEKYIPATISYIVAALQYKPTDVPQYHFQLLDLSLKLLEKANEKTLKKVANLESGLIACLWLPIDFVGDFNTQMAALRLLIQLLKCIDDTKQHQELERICTSQKTVLRDSICGAVQVANFHAGKFEKAARELLNNYNMNLAKNVLVYSMRCKSVKFGENTSFYKPLNTDYLWIDLNYCPRTLTFNARYRSSNKEKFVNVGVSLQIQKLSLFKKTLSVVLNASPHFTKNISNQNKLKSLRKLQFELITDEALRLKENNLVLEYYNAAASSGINVENSIKTPSGASDTTSEDSVEVSPLKNMPAANVITIEQKTATEVNVHKNPIVEVEELGQLSKDNFQKSYNFLIGHSGEIQKLNCSQNKTVTVTADQNSPTLFNSPDSEKTFKIPSLPFYENALLKKKLSQQSKKDMNKSSQETKADTRALTPTPTVKESPKTSHPVVETSENISQKDSHPIAKLTRPNGNGKRRFFSRQNENSESDTSQGAKKIKLTKNSGKKRCSKYEKMFTSPPKRKQINKVKPMNHLAKNDGDPEEAVQEYVENGGIVNITNFLRNGNESAAVFNEDERRIILQNVHRINENLERTAKKFFKKTGENQTESATAEKAVDDIYDERNVSEAEPGQSYRNFRVRRKKAEELYMDKSKPKTIKRCRNVTKTKKTTTVKKNQGMNSKEENVLNVASTSKVELPKTKPKVIKRKASAPMIAAPTVLNTTAPETTVSHSPKRPDKLQNKTTYSQDIQIDLTCLDDDVVEITVPSNSGKIYSQVRKSGEQNSPAKKVKISRDLFEQAKRCIRRSVTIDKNNNNSNNKNITTLSPMTISESSFKLDDIQECRHDVTIEQLIADENIWRTPTNRSCNELHSPNLSDAMNVSDINESPDKERTRQLSRKRESNCNKSLFDVVSSLNNATNNGENNNQADELAVDVSEQPIEKCILYQERSDAESSESENETTLERTSSAHLEQISLTPNKVSVERIATKSITRSTRTSLSGNQPKLQACEVTTTSVTTHKIISQDLFLVPTTSAEASSASHEVQHEKSVNERAESESEANFLISKLPDLNEISQCMMPYKHTLQDIDITRNPLYKDIFEVLQNFKENMKQEFENLHSCIKFDAFIEKVVDVSKRLLVEAENERLDMEQSGKEIAKIIRQLNWHWETYQKKTERFNCFKQNIEQYLNALTEIDFEADINNEFEQFLTKLRNKSTELSTKLWQEFIKETTDNLVNNISSFSTL